MSGAFSRPLYVGQHNRPTWQQFESAFRGIFERRFFANGGPLVRALDIAFADTVGVTNSISVTNHCVALMILLKSLNVKGEVIVPALASPALPQAVWWAGLKPVLADVDPLSLMLSPSTVRRALSAQTAVILGSRVFGRGDGSVELESFAAERGLQLIFDASSATACSYASRPIGSFGVGEAFSLHSTDLISAAEGGSITTNSPQLATKLKTIRNFAVSSEDVPLRINGKMAEAPAALALLGLDSLSSILADNRRRYALYEQHFYRLPGIAIEQFSPSDINNFQSIVIRVDRSIAGMDAAALVQQLENCNIFAKCPFGEGLSRRQNCGIEVSEIQTFDVTDELVKQLVQLPSGNTIEDREIEFICDTIQALCRGRARKPSASR